MKHKKKASVVGCILILTLVAGLLGVAFMQQQKSKNQWLTPEDIEQILPADDADTEEFASESTNETMSDGGQDTETIQGEDDYIVSEPSILVQHSDISGNQSMFYTILTPEGLIVIDGGWSANADYVREVIDVYGNVVDAWILTHPHPDHMGAFNEIYENPDGISIGEIYTIEMNYERYKSVAQSWDDFPVFERFVNLTAGDEIHYLYEGDELTICGLQMQVFNTYTDAISEYTGDYANQGSMVFRLAGSKDSILFCSDVYGDYISNRLVETYGDALESTYIQMGHHGNNSVKQVLVECVKPQAAFFDAPEWLVTGENYDTSHNIEMVQILGADYYTYQTAPNVVELR